MRFISYTGDYPNLCSGVLTLEIDGKEYNFDHKDFETVPPLKDIIGEDAANEVIDFVTARREFYKFDRAGSDFKSLVSLSDSPTSNYAKVVEYWKTQGVDLNIDKRELTDDQFWDEEHGISEEAE